MSALPPAADPAPTDVARPKAITVICVVGFIGALFALPMIFSPVARGIGAWYPPYLAFSSVVGFVCMVGLWKLKKWAILTYTGLAAVNQVVMLAMGVWNILVLLIPGIIVAIGFIYFAKMR